MKTYEFAYGKGTQKVDLPEEHIIYDLHGKEVAVEKDIAAAALKAIRNPIDRTRAFLTAILILSSLPEPTGPRPRKRIFWCWGKPW